MHVSCTFAYMPSAHHRIFLFPFIADLFLARSLIFHFLLYRHASVTQICNVLANGTGHGYPLNRVFTFSARVPAPMSGSRERKLAGSGHVTASIVSYRHGYKSRTIPRENGFQWAARDRWMIRRLSVRPLGDGRRNKRGETG